MSRRGTAAALAACLSALTAGCATGARRQPASGNTAPAALQTLSVDATAMVASAGAKDWSSVSAQLTGLEQAWTTLRPSAAARGARAGLLNSVDAAVTDVASQADALRPMATQVAANHLTAYVPDLMALYSGPVPPQLLEMQFLGRELELNVNAGATSALWNDARTLGTQWAYIRPAAQRVDAPDASRLDPQIADLDSAVAAAAAGSPAIPAAATLFTGPGPAVTGLAAGSSTMAGGSSASGPATSGSAASASSASATGASAGTSSAAGQGAPKPASSTTSRTAPAVSSGSGSGTTASGVQSGSGSAVLTAAAQILSTLGNLQRAFGGGA